MCIDYKHVRTFLLPIMIKKLQNEIIKFFQNLIIWFKYMIIYVNSSLIYQDQDDHMSR